MMKQTSHPIPLWVVKLSHTWKTFPNPKTHLIPSLSRPKGASHDGGRGLTPYFHPSHTLFVTLSLPHNCCLPACLFEQTVAAVNIKTHVAANQTKPEIVSVTVMYLSRVQTDLPTPKDEWNTLRHLRHFSCVRRLDGQVSFGGVCLKLTCLVERWM